ncbi:flagellar motor stator protein MotA [Novosphingobium profundi]|uniref:flagellar motor stator protein MotA n=1 Tax=Novosphingobium profundi TaxID=1774954 RepID=UPI001BD95502|nr:flagellar motor stator protein MotA [Novosphingobium profundi]MBT0670558.1 flagellar motor stator protein MotA [Novosphingobium profundi]
MLNAIGLAIILVCVFGSFLMSGGKIAVVLHALPHEMMAIAGAAVGAFLVSNSLANAKKTWVGIVRVFKGGRWTSADFRDLLSLLYQLLLTFRREGGSGIEKHIDAPDDSPIFKRFPKLVQDKGLIEFICDYLRMMTVNFEDPHQLAEAMEGDIERHHAEELQPQHALQVMADGLPALGIVAAVLGVIKTMSSIDQPTEVLGAMIGGALVGTFLGVLLAYCLVGPIAQKLQQIIDSDFKPYLIVKTAIVGYAQEQPIEVVIELARRMTPSPYAPTFSELEMALDEVKEQLNANPA